MHALSVGARSKVGNFVGSCSIRIICGESVRFGQSYRKKPRAPRVQLGRPTGTVARIWVNIGSRLRARRCGCRNCQRIEQAPRSGCRERLSVEADIASSFGMPPSRPLPARCRRRLSVTPTIGRSRAIRQRLRRCHRAAPPRPTPQRRQVAGAGRRKSAERIGKTVIPGHRADAACGMSSPMAATDRAAAVGRLAIAGVRRRWLPARNAGAVPGAAAGAGEARLSG